MSKELDWEKEFEHKCSRWTSMGGFIIAETDEGEIYQPNAIRKYIKRLLTAKEDALRKAIEGMLQECPYCDGKNGTDCSVRHWNETLNEVLALLDRKEI